MNKILIVDDEPNNRILLQEILEDFEECGTRLLYAADGAEALDIIQKEKPDIVFLDIMLPEIGGFEVCHTIKHKPGMEKVFIVILTANSQEADKRKAAELKADMYITKPFKAKVIVDVVNEVLGTAIGK